jgi:hypothetical protein
MHCMRGGWHRYTRGKAANAFDERKGDKQMCASRINPLRWPRRWQIAGVVFLGAAFATPYFMEQVEYYTWHR